MDPAASIILSLFTLLLISTGVFFLSKKVRIPYTVFLVLIGLLLIPVSRTEMFSFIGSFELTPALLFYVFLPILIFESAYQMNAKTVLKNIGSISSLAVVGLLISAFFIAWVLTFAFGLIGLEIPFIVALLFGTLISSTDPVAVLALFKEYGAPKRLSLLFEGESLFNDGTALALFFIVLQIALVGWNGVESVGEGIFMFTTMVFGGVVFGLVMGGVFSKLIEYVKNSEHVELTLTMIVAHLTFLFTEMVSMQLTIFGYDIRISSIVATVVASMVIGNYGRYKISPKVEKYMEKFWGYFAFVTNSIVFILMGLLFASLPMTLENMLLPIAITILVVAIARTLAVYPVLSFVNWTKKEDPIPMAWQHLMAWGSLRGAIAITMVLLIPDDLVVAGWAYEGQFTVKEFVTAITIGCIYFTIFVKATTIGPLLKRLKLSELNLVERIEYEESKAFIYAKVLLKLSKFHNKGYITDAVYGKLREKYEALYRESCDRFRAIASDSEHTLEKVLSMYAVGVEKYALRELFMYEEVTESVYRKIMQELHAQMDVLERGGEMSSEDVGTFEKDWLDTSSEWVTRLLTRRKEDRGGPSALYMYYRAKAVIAQKAARELSLLAESGAGVFENGRAFELAVERYERLEERAKEKAAEVYTAHTQELSALDERFAERGVFKAEEKILNELHEKEMIPPKLYIMLHDELEKGGVR